ncbi:MAG TPA: hypothetical protein VLT61_03995 [Anaeromyxobacteraceae bacterium]|nr:hypothetical protein [Anaeromyxobacteraceae bacterium]
MRTTTASLPMKCLTVAALALVASRAAAQPWPADPSPHAPEPEAPPAARPPAPSFRPAFGGASIVFTDVGGRRIEQDGVALQLRLTNPISARFDANVSITWGLTDWERAKEWIDAGNSSGAWTTEKIESVANWVGEGGDSQGLRFLGAIFAEFFLVATYAAVPFCYVGSVGGATSHLQLDVTGTAHLTRGFVDLWAEGGVGMAGLPAQFMAWNYAVGPVIGVGVDAGPLRVGARALWSPGGLNSSTRGDRSVTTASLTVGTRD